MPFVVDQHLIGARLERCGLITLPIAAGGVFLLHLAIGGTWNWLWIIAAIAWTIACIGVLPRPLGKFVDRHTNLFYAERRAREYRWMDHQQRALEELARWEETQAASDPDRNRRLNRGGEGPPIRWTVEALQLSAEEAELLRRAKPADPSNGDHQAQLMLGNLLLARGYTREGTRLRSWASAAGFPLDPSPYDG